MALLGASATTVSSAPREAALPLATQWHAPLPHGGRLADASRFWAQFDDPLLIALVEAGQQVSPTLAEAAARIAEARALRGSARAALWPVSEASAEWSRGKQAFGGVGPVASARMSSASLQASWDVDVAGAARAGANAARVRLEASQARWHDARVSVAAEVATTYAELRACEARAGQVELDAGSRAQTARLTALASRAGFQPPAAADQAAASEAQGTLALIRQRAECDLLVKALSALTAQDEAALRRDLAPGAGRLPQPAELRVAVVPAEALAQRPDLYAAARDVLAAGADWAQARASRWPRISLGGSIGATRIGADGPAISGSLWSLGPVTVTLPVFDGGARRANVRAARARYDAALTVYAARLRDAIREVENALVTLESSARRAEAALTAVRGFQRSFEATEASQRVGLASLFELEDARRSKLAAEGDVIDLRRERVCAWIALYRALGGGWSAARLADTSPDARQR